MARPVKVSPPTYTNLPPGIYTAKLESITDTEKPHAEYGMGLIWKFVIEEGAHFGEDVERLTSPDPTEGNICGRLFAGCMGIAKIKEGEAYDLDDAIGKSCQVIVKQYKERTRVDDVMPLGPVAPTAPRPPAAPKAPPRPGKAPKPPPQDKFWVETGEEGGELPLMGCVDLQRWINEKQLDPESVTVCKEGTEKWTTADAFGFKSDIPF